MKRWNRALELISAIVGSFLLGGILLFLVSALGEGIDKYVFPRPLWQVWIAYFITGGLVIYLYREHHKQ